MDQEDKYLDYSNLPIPTYEEAISSRPTSSQNYRGAQEISDDAERQGLLEQGGVGAYRQPTVESARSSVDSDLRLPEVNGDDDRRAIEELDYLDPADDSSPNRRGMYHRARLRANKHLANLSATFSSLRLPSFRSLYSPVATGEEASAPETTPAPRRTRFMDFRPPGISNLSIPEQYRLSAPTFARLCGLFTIAGVIYMLFALEMIGPKGRQIGRYFDPEAVRQFVQEHVDGDNIKSYLHHITSYDHVAGTEGDLYLAKWMEERWLEEGGFDSVRLWDYYVYLNYPTKGGRSVKIVEPESKRWEAKLEEGQVDRNMQQTWAWHGHSRSGEVKGHLIFANGGSRDDFKWLKDQGVEAEGAVALVRYYGTQSDTGLKIKAAEEAGCVGVLIYSDPGDDGAGNGEVWPDGPWRPGNSLQRDSVVSPAWVLGDPLTPGTASKHNALRVDIDSNPLLPRIPSLPLAWRDAKILIEMLDDQGVEVPKNWVGSPLPKKSTWFSGSKEGKSAPIIELRNHNDDSPTQRIYNLHGIIEGLESPSKKVIVGNHRDSWCLGAVDPGSGSAIMTEVVSIFLQLRQIGWRPLRTIEFVSWDAGEFNMAGSTEYVEDNVGYLRDNGIAYLNVDAGVYGQNFRAAGSPLVRKALMRVLGRVSDPVSNNTLKQLWQQRNSKLHGLDADGDYVAFQDMAGTSSIDFGFEGDTHAYPAGSCYETFNWVQKFGDPGFKYHHTLAQIWALLILEISDRPLIPFDLRPYAKAVHLYVKQLQQYAEQTYSGINPDKEDEKKALNPELLKQYTNGIFDLSPLQNAATNLSNAVHAFHKFEDLWSTNVMGAGGLESAHFAFQRLSYNDKIAHFETDMLDLPYEHGKNGPHGIPGREQFKHVLFGPTKWGGRKEVGHFPAVRDAIEEGDWEGAQRAVVKAAEVIERAGRRLNED